MNKSQQTTLLNLVKRLLQTRRDFHPKAEEAAMAKLITFCHKHEVDPADAIEQGTAHLKKNSIAANMQGWV